MKKLWLMLLTSLVFLNIAFPIVTVYARSPKPEVWVLGQPKGKGRPQPSQTTPWGIDRINAPEAWPTSTGVGVQIAVLDTGVDMEHKDLYVNIAWGISVVGDKESTIERDWKDKNGHGTHVTGTIAAMYNDIGVVGVGYDIEIYAIKVMTDAGFGYWEDVADGIWWAIKGPDGIIDKDDDGIVAGDPDDDAAEIISMSFGGTSYEKEVHDAMKAAYAAGIVLVAAAGNEGDDGVLYPAKFDEVIAVAAIDEDDNVPWWSSKGTEVELAAPGVSILSTIPKDRYEYYSGTSMACPHVSGTAGLMISKILVEGRTYTVKGIRDILQTTADDIGPSGWDEASGYGVVRADKAVAEA
jgi:subtilisin family serine protease